MEDDTLKLDLDHALDEEDEMSGPMQFYEFICEIIARWTGFGVVLLLALIAMLAAAYVYPN